MELIPCLLFKIIKVKIKDYVLHQKMELHGLVRFVHILVPDNQSGLYGYVWGAICWLQVPNPVVFGGGVYYNNGF